MSVLADISDGGAIFLLGSLALVLAAVVSVLACLATKVARGSVPRSIVVQTIVLVAAATLDVGFIALWTAFS